MKLCKFRHQAGHVGVGIVENEGDAVVPLGDVHLRLSDLLEAADIVAAVDRLPRGESIPSQQITWLPPIDAQEVWAAGVTYIRSRAARMEESEAAASCYDRVYVADRPELFFKATPSRVVGSGEPVRIRRDAAWNVPEPELTLVMNSRLELVGFTIGNDMSSRDIEGENPLYLPQAKTYDACCALGPWITLRHAMPDHEDGRGNFEIQLRVLRNESLVFSGQTSTSQLARTFQHLIGYLGRDQTFSQGVCLLTGTGIVPDSSFTLLPGDIVEIDIAGIGTLRNPVMQH